MELNVANSHNKRLNCILYSHPWAVTQLDDSGLLPGNGEVLVELAQTSLLAHTLKPVSTMQKPSILEALKMFDANLSSDGGSFLKIFRNSIPDTLSISAKKFNGISAPLIMAPVSGISPTAQIASLLSALALPSRYKIVTALIQYQDAIQFAGLFSYVDEFNIVWDVADLPDKNLVDLTTTLVADYQITKERWGKFQLCHAPNRSPPEEENRVGHYQSVINEFFEYTQC